MALLTAGSPTPTERASSLRPTASANCSAVIDGSLMSPYYSQQVNFSKITISDLNKNSLHVNLPLMDKQPTQYADIAERLEIIRQGFSELSKKDWAAKNGFNQTQYQNWSSGERRITVDAAQRLCDDYGLSLDFIYRGRIDGLSETVRKIVLSARPTA